MLVHDDLQLLRQGDLLRGELIGTDEVVAHLRSHALLARVRLVTAVRPDPFLYLSIAVLNQLYAVAILPVPVGNLILQEANLFWKILNAVEPVVEDDGRVESLGRRHPPDEVDGQIVSRHFAC